MLQSLKRMWQTIRKAFARKKTEIPPKVQSLKKSITLWEKPMHGGNWKFNRHKSICGTGKRLQRFILENANRDLTKI